jgi:hypothetical protein
VNGTRRCRFGDRMAGYIEVEDMPLADEYRLI